MRTKFFFIVFLFFLMPSYLFAGTAHYVDCSARVNGNGTYVSPWNNISSVNNHIFSTGDDVYFRINTTCTASTYLDIDWDGTSNDYAIVGAYYGEEQFGLNGNDRPIIDGNSNTVPSESYKGLIIKNSGTGYVTIKNLKIQYAGYYGVSFSDISYGTIENNIIWRSRRSAIMVARTDHATVDGNTVYDNQYPSASLGGAAIEITSVGDALETHDVTVSNNIVYNVYNEGIGVYNDCYNITIEGNTVYDTSSYGIYLDRSDETIIRNNLVYSSSNPSRYNYNGLRGIALGQEVLPPYICRDQDIEIYGNYIFATDVGIGVESDLARYGSQPNCTYDNVKIYNNVITDPRSFCFRLDVGNSTAATGNEYKNNICYRPTSSDYFITNSINYSPSGWTYSNNNWYAYYNGTLYTTLSGTQGTNQVIGDPGLKKISGWRSILQGKGTRDDFVLTGSGVADNAGTQIPGYTTKNDSNPNIGPSGLVLSAPIGLHLVNK